MENLIHSSEETRELLDNIFNFIKVINYEDYRRIKKYILPYSSYDYFKKNNPLREQLEFDCIMMIRARLQDNFLEFCRYTYLQVEILIDAMIQTKHQKEEIEIEIGDYGQIKGLKVKSCGKFYKNTINFCFQKINLDHQNRSIIYLVKELRNIVSHRDASIPEIESRIKAHSQKYNNKIIISKIPTGVSKEEIVNKCKEFNANIIKNDNIRKSKKENNYIAVYLEDEKQAQQVIENLHKKKWENTNHELIVYFADNNNLNEFYCSSDYKQVTEALKSFVTSFIAEMSEY
jgi:hypothetical protein